MKKFLCFLLIASFLGSSYRIFSVGPITFHAFRVIFVIFSVCFAIFKRDIKNTRMPKGAFSRYKFYLGAFLLFMAATIVLTPSFSIWINGCIFWLINIMLIYYVYAYTDTEEDLNRYVRAYMLGLFITMAISVFEYLTGYHMGVSSYLQHYSVYSWEFRALSKFPTAFLYNPNNVGVAMMIATAFGGAFLKRRSGAMWLFVAWSALCIYVAFATGSRGAIIFCIALFAIIVFTMPATRGAKIFRYIFIILGVIVFVRLFSQFLGLQLERSGLLNGIIGTGEQDEGRIAVINAALKTAKDVWFFGVGPSAAEEAMSGFVGHEITSVHNFPLELLVTIGAAGSVVFWMFYIRCVKKQKELKSKLQISSTLHTVLISFLFVGLVPPTIVTLNFIWVIFGFALAAEKIYYKNRMAEISRITGRML